MKPKIQCSTRFLSISKIYFLFFSCLTITIVAIEEEEERTLIFDAPSNAESIYHFAFSDFIDQKSVDLTKKLGIRSIVSAFRNTNKQWVFVDENSDVYSYNGFDLEQIRSPFNEPLKHIFKIEDKLFFTASQNRKLIVYHCNDGNWISFDFPEKFWNLNIVDTEINFLQKSVVFMYGSGNERNFLSFNYIDNSFFDLGLIEIGIDENWQDLQ
ncbi:MAG: hypothetical protein HRU19_32775 [Pseudobacteriovorax sp.]|nr:hypothetical protein [Pseudobacteriovorax sp.]